MIEYKNGDLLNVTEGIILHGCNGQGVMGAGVAKAIKMKYPEVFTAYKEGSMYLGTVTKEWVGEDLIVMNGVVQKFYGRDGKRYVNYAALCEVFREAVSLADCFSYTLNFPKIGAGLGGGDWGVIEQLINDCDPEDKVRKVCWEL